MKMSNSNYKQTNYQSAKTERIKTVSSNLSSQEQHFFTSRYRTQHQNDSYLELAFSKTKKHYGKSYLQMKQDNRTQIDIEASKEGKNFSKIFAFKNLNEFEKSMQTQKKLISSTSSVSLKGFGVATFKGINKSINSHQISVHIGPTNVFTLFQGYDGILSSVTLKKKYLPTFLQIVRKRRSSYREESFKVIEQSIKKAISLSQEQLNKIQNELGDNSGSSLLSLIVHNGMVFAANCGQSAVLCCTVKNKILELAVPHTTNNASEVERIIKSGGRLFQTVINIPYKTSMNIKGPLRVAPNGLKYTRTLGKCLYDKQKGEDDKKVDNNKILRVAQIKYLPQTEIRWLAILSSRLYEAISIHRIKDIVQQQLLKRTKAYGNDDAAEHICKRLLLEAVQLGIDQNTTAAVLIFNTIKEEETNQPQKDKSSQLKAVQEPRKANLSFEKKSMKESRSRSFLMPEKKQKSLKYIGNRVNFVQQMDPHSFYC